MKVTSLLSLALGALLSAGLAAPALAQSAQDGSPALALEAVVSQPREATAPENIDGSRVNAKVQAEVKRIWDAYRAIEPNTPAQRESRVAAINRLEKLLEDDSKNLSLHSVLGYFYISNGEAGRAIPILEAIDGKSRFDETNNNTRRNLALAFYLNRDYKKAAEAYKKLSADGGMDSQAARFAGSALLLDGQYDEAAKVLDGARSSATGAAKTALLKDLALAYIRANKQSEALAVYEELIQDDSTDVEVLSWMGYSYNRDRRWDEAIAVLEKAKTRAATNVAVLTNLGNAYLNRGSEGDSAKALEIYRSLVQVEPRNATIHYNIGVLRMKEQQYEQAVPSFAKAVELAPGAESRFAWNNLGFCLDRLNRHKEAAAAYARASDFDTTSATFARNAGLAFAKANMPAESRKYLDRAKANGAEDVGVSTNLVESQVREGRLAEALATLKQQAAASPDSADIWFNIGVLSYRTGDLDGSEQAYRKSLELRPDDGDALKNLGLLLVERNKSEEAVGLLEKMVGANPSSVEGRLALATAYVKVDRLSDAVGVWREVVRMDPNRSDARLNLADGLWNLGLSRDARFHYATVHRAQPNNARALNGLGLWSLEQGDAKAAEAQFRRATQADANYLPAYNNLAISLERLNRKAEAILILQRALQRDPNFRDARANLERMQGR